MSKMGIFSKFEGKMEATFEGDGSSGKSPISPVQIIKKAEKQMRREKMVSAGKEYAPTLYTVLVNANDDQQLFGFYPTLAGECETRLSAAASNEGLSLDCQPLVRFIVDDSLKHGKFDVIAEVVSAPIIQQLRAEEMQRYGLGDASSASSQADEYNQQQSYGAQNYNNQPGYNQGNQAAYGQNLQSGYPQSGYGAPVQQGAYGAYPQQAPLQAYGVQAGGYAPSAGYPPAPQNPYASQNAYPASGAYPQSQGAYPLQGAYPAQQGAYPSQEASSAKPPLPHVPEEEIDRSINYGEYTFNSKDFTDYDESDTLSEESHEKTSEDAGQKNSGMFADEEPLPGEPLSTQDSASSNPSSNEASRSNEPHTPDNASDAAQQQQAPSQGQNAASAYGPVDQYGRPVQAQQPGAYPQYPNAYQAAGAVQAPPQAPQGMGAAGPNQNLYGMPNTVNFTAGAGEVNPVPHQGAVRAQLTDMTSNRTYDLATNRILIGRETGNDIVVNDLNASRQHAQIEYEPQGVWVITDLGSTNGTLVNGQPVQRRGLQNGDRITLGVTEFVFSQR